MVAANVDRLLAVVAAAAPDPNRGIVDRLLLVAEANDLDAVLVVNKMDLEAVDRTGRRLAELYRGIGYRTLLTSAETGRGIAELEAEVCSGASALVGPSGAGKSSLLNAVDRTLDLRTGGLSRKSRRGRHTTVAARLIELPCGGWVADTPGLGDIGIWGLEPERLETCFPDFVPYLGGCRFRGCAHLEEPGCAVKEAVDGGAIDPGRHATYRSVREELQEAAERRRRG